MNKKKIFFFLALFFSGVLSSQPFKPDFVLKRDQYTNFLVYDGERSGGLSPNTYGQPVTHMKFWVDNWNKSSQQVSWSIHSPSDDDYLVNILYNQHDSAALKIDVHMDNQMVTYFTQPYERGEWKRVSMHGLLHAANGVHSLTLTIQPLTGNDSFNISVHGIELVRPAIKKKLDSIADYFHMHTDTRWFRKCRYGLFVTWTSQVYPRHRAVNYYYRSPDWLSLYKTAKAGNPKRLVGFNPWKLPSPTAFMDYYVGETITDPSSGGMLKKGGDGKILSGPYQGLQASATFVTESEDWGHFKKEEAIMPFRYTVQELATMIHDFAAYGNVPMFNLEIYQNGHMSENSIAVFEEARMLKHENTSKKLTSNSYLN